MRSRRFMTGDGLAQPFEQPFEFGLLTLDGRKAHFHISAERMQLTPQLAQLAPQLLTQLIHLAP